MGGAVQLEQIGQGVNEMDNATVMQAAEMVVQVAAADIHAMVSVTAEQLADGANPIFMVGHVGRTLEEVGTPSNIHVMLGTAIVLLALVQNQDKGLDISL